MSLDSIDAQRHLVNCCCRAKMLGGTNNFEQRHNVSAASVVIPAQAQDCPGRIEGQFFREFAAEFCFEKPLARACPGHPRLDATAIFAMKTWMARPSPATGRLSERTGVWPRNRARFPGEPRAKAGILGPGPQRLSPVQATGRLWTPICVRVTTIYGAAAIHFIGRI